MPMTPERKAALEKYLGGKGKDEKPKDEAKPKGDSEVEGEDDSEEMDLEGPGSYRGGDEGEPEVEVYGADEDPSDPMNHTDKPPRDEDPKARGKRFGAKNRDALSKSYMDAKNMMGGR